MSAPPPPPLTTSEKLLEAADAAADRELAALLKSPAFIEELTSAELQGAERRRYYEQKTIQLGAKPAKTKTPSKILMGMRNAASVRARKSISELKESGMHSKSAQSKILAPLARPRKKTFKPPPNEMGTIGKFKNGMLVVSKRQIEKVERDGQRDKRARRKQSDPWGESKPKGKKKGGKKKKR
jgi:hypothetical protein